MALALVLGCGENVFDDAARLHELCTPDAYIAVKDMIIKWPLRVDYGISLHPDRSKGYLKERGILGRNTNFEIWAHSQPSALVIQHRTTDDWQGSSGLLGVKVALEEGFDGVVCAGIPMDAAYGHIARKKEWISAQIFRKGWLIHINEIKFKTRSMSGWTSELLGEPTTEWLKSLKSAPPNRITVDLIQSASPTRREECLP